MMNIQVWQWAILLISGVAFFFAAPVSSTVSEFYSALSVKGNQPGFFVLTSSLVISWIFAKSISNAADLGLQFGFVGGIAYAVYYLSFLVAGVVIYQLRLKGGFSSIHQFLQTRFGKRAVIIFSVLVGFRLFNEVWSNTMVIGSYFGETGSTTYYFSILIFTALTLAYTLKGGLRSSMLTDAIQMVLFGMLLFIILSILFQDNRSVGQFIESGDWSMAGGLNLLFAAFIQIFSYPFHDSVLTDRGFISPPRTTLRSFVAAAAIGFVCIAAFSFVGIYAGFLGLATPAALNVSKVLGVGAMLTMNFIMVTSAASTLDSAFSSFSKLAVIDIGRKKTQTVRNGRIMMVLITVVGTLPIFASPEILSATTISGTMVIGLAPIFILWKIKAPPLSFYLAVGTSVIIGIVLALDMFPESLHFTDGKYADLLATNVYGMVLCFVLFLIPVILKHARTK